MKEFLEKYGKLKKTSDKSDVKKDNIDTDKKEVVKKYDASKIQKLFENSLRYKDSLGLPKKWADNENFKLGEQWGTITEKTKNYPRPVLNFCNYIIEHKTSQIQSENVKMVFTSQGDTDMGDTFTKFSDSEYERMKISDLNSFILDDAATKGLGIAYYYIDGADDGVVHLQREKIDPCNIHVSNPKETDIQKMAWICILQRLPLEDVEDMAKENGLDVVLEEDKEVKGNEYANKDVDIDGIEKVNLINFFYRDRKTKQIHYMKICANNIIQDDTNLEIKKYPFAVIQWANKTQDFYSKGEIDFLKSNQKQVNALMGLQLMNQQLAGFPKMWTKKGALNPKSVKGNIGEILVDNSQAQGLNFGWLQPAPLNQFATVLQDNLINHTKSLNNAHDVDTGSGKADNATAIMLLQKRSGVALDKLKRKYHQYIEDTANIWLEFFCNYYIFDREFTYTDHMGQEQTADFNAQNIDTSMLNVKVDIGVSSAWSEEFTLNSLDKFLQMGLIDFKTYLKYIPVNVVPFKESLLKDMELKEEQQQEEAKEYLLSTMTPEEQELFYAMDETSQQQILLELAKQEEALGLAEQNGQLPLQQANNGV